MISWIFRLVERWMIGGIESWTEHERWTQVLTPRNKQKFCARDMQTEVSPEEMLEIQRFFQDVFCYLVSTIQVSGLYDVRKARKERQFSLS